MSRTIFTASRLLGVDALLLQRRDEVLLGPGQRVRHRQERVLDGAGLPRRRVAGFHDGLLRVEQPELHPLLGLLLVVRLAGDDALERVQAGAGPLAALRSDEDGAILDRNRIDSDGRALLACWAKA